MALVRNKQKIAPTLSFLSSPLSSVGSRNTSCSYLSLFPCADEQQLLKGSLFPTQQPLVACHVRRTVLALGRLERAAPAGGRVHRGRGTRASGGRDRCDGSEGVKAGGSKIGNGKGRSGAAGGASTSSSDDGDKERLRGGRAMAVRTSAQWR